jgi:hypothetical protein
MMNQRRPCFLETYSIYKINTFEDNCLVTATLRFTLYGVR